MKWTTHRKALVAWTVLMLSLLVTACSPSEPDSHGEPAPEPHDEGFVELGPEMLVSADVRTAAVSVRVLPAELQTTGQVDFEQDRLAHVTPRIPGRVQQVLADLGERVLEGQTLAVIDSIEFGRAKSDHLQAKAHEDLARQNYEREDELFGERISSEKEMLAAKAAHLEAVARLRNTEETLRLYGLEREQILSLRHDDDHASLLPVRAPLAGRVVEKHVTVGELVTPERSMFTLADLSHVWIWIDVYEQDLRNVHLEDDVLVAVDAYPSEAFGGKLSYISAQVDADTRTVRARIDVDNPEHKLRPGMFARVTLSDPHFGDSAQAPSVVVPAGAVQRDGDGFVVFVPRGEGRFERCEVRVGRTSGGFAEILSGLDPADTVVVEGAFLLKSEASKEQMGAGHEH